MRIWPIVKHARELEKQYEWGFIFRWDQGSYETRLDIREDGIWTIGNGNLPLDDFTMICPDILVMFQGRVVGVIEFEEEAKPDKGAKKRKGHFEGNKRDSKRDGLYKAAKLDLLKIWESNKDWNKDIKKFLVVLYCKRMQWK